MTLNPTLAESTAEADVLSTGSSKHIYYKLIRFFEFFLIFTQKDEAELYDWEQHLVDDGFLLLASKVRKLEEEKVVFQFKFSLLQSTDVCVFLQVIEEVLEKHFRRSVDHDRLFGLDAISSLVKKLPRDFDHVVWTKPMRRQVWYFVLKSVCV